MLHFGTLYFVTSVENAVAGFVVTHVLINHCLVVVAIGKTVLCGDALERVRSGAGVKYVFFDADFYKEQAQRAIVAPLNSAGSLSLF